MAGTLAGSRRRRRGMHRSDIATLFALGAALMIAIGDVIQ
jgi:hypothetical protein